MAQMNVEVVKKAYEALAKKDVKAIALLSDDEIEVRQSEELPWGGVYRGPEEAVIFFEKVTSFIESEVSLERILDAGDYVAVTGRTKGRVKHTGASFDVPLVHLWQVREGRIASLAVYLDHTAIMPALNVARAAG